MRRQAWREKVAIFTLYILISGLFCFWLEFITTLFCDPPKTYDFRDIYTPSSHYSTINGQVIDWRKYGNSSEMTKQANKYPQLDLSPMFPTFMLLQRPTGQKSYNHKIIDACINGFNRSEQADNWLNYKLTHDPGYRFENGQLLSCPLPTHRNKTGAPCFYTLADQYQLATYPKKGGKCISLYTRVLINSSFVL